MMQASETTIPNPISAACTDCEQTRRFTADTADSDELTITYECVECGHEIRLDLDPEASQ